MGATALQAAAFDIVALGEAMIEFNQTRADDPRSYRLGYGGDTSNAIIAAARQGARCAYCTRVGDDAFGRQLLELWRGEGVDTSAVQVDAQAPTGVYFVHHRPAGHEFSYLRAGSAASRMTPQDLPLALIGRSRTLHVSGISQGISARAQETVDAAIAAARNAGATVSYDPNLRLRLWTLDRARAAIESTIALTDEFLPSLDDVQQISGRTEPAEIVAWAHDLGARTVVLKLGSQGALVSDGRGLTTAVPALPVSAVDATGAGDCFDGTYLTRRALGDDPVTAARWACAAAALATMGFGAVDPLPTREQVAGVMATMAR